MLNLVCFLEEPSARIMFEAILPKLLPDDVYPQYVIFEGKQDLEKQIQKRIQYYNAPNAVFLVMRDQDTADCYVVKQGLVEKVRASGKLEKTLIRVACHELESFFLGDLNAVEKGLGVSGLVKMQNRQKFRTPDHLANAAEELKKITDHRYMKLAGSRAISSHLVLDGSNRSTSFNVLITGLEKLVSI